MFSTEKESDTVGIYNKEFSTDAVVDMAQGIAVGCIVPSNGYTAQSLAGISGNWLHKLILAALDEETTQIPCQLYPLRQVSLTSAIRKQPSHCLGTLQSGRLKDLYKVRVCKQRPRGATGCLVSLPMRNVICCILRFCTVFFSCPKNNRIISWFSVRD